MSEPKYRELGWRGRLSADDDRGYSPAPSGQDGGGRDFREEVEAMNLPPAFSPAKEDPAFSPAKEDPAVPAGYEVSAQPGAGVGLRNVRGGFAPDVAGAPGGVPGGGKGESTMPMGGKAEQERAKAEREKAERERTAKEREEVARAYDVPITSLQQLMDRIGLESDDERKTREKREKSRRIISAVSDGLSALGNLYFTSQYAPDMYEHEKESRLRSTNGRIEKLREERDKDRDRWLDYAMRIGQWQTARDRELRNFDDTKFKQRILANQEERAGKEYGWKERIYGEKQKQEANRTKKSEEDAKKAESDAKTAAAKAKYAEDNEKSKINKNNTAAGANRARANASNASADASRARAAKTRSGGGGRGRGGGKKSDLDIVETTVTTSSKKNGVTTRTTTKTKSRTGQMKPGFAKGLKFKK